MEYQKLLFTFTLLVTILTNIKFISIICKSPIKYNGIIGYKETTPDAWYIMYPSLFYQTYYWCNVLIF